MKRRFRLTRSIDFKRVRNQGKSYAHPLLVLVKLPATEARLRVGLSASRALGGAVERNRAKRRLRELIRPRLLTLPAGWDLILVARAPLLQASFSDLRLALDGLFERAGLKVHSGQDPDVC